MTIAALSPALQRCFDEVADSAPMALERCLNQVIGVLQQAEGASRRTAERIELGDAWRELARNQPDWCRRYPEELRAAFRSAGRNEAASPPKAATRPGGSAFQELALVEESDILQAIEASRLLQHLTPLVEQRMPELDALVSSAMGLPTVRPDLNPVRPETFATGLRALAGRSNLTAATGSLWMKYMAEPLGQELQGLYARLVAQLKDAHVNAAEYRLQRSREAEHGGGEPKAARPARDREAVAGALDASLSRHQISHASLKDFLVDGGGAEAAQALPPSYYAEVERELHELASEPAGEQHVVLFDELPPGYRELPSVDRPLREVGVQSTLSEEVWGGYAHSRERSLVRGRLRKDATRVAQVLGLELVRKVVNQVARDPRLLTPVREAIVALEPSLLRLAMVDPRFFSEEQHPGRRLMERVAQRSFNYNDEFSTEFAGFFEGVSSAFKALNELAIDNTQPFDDALAALEATWTAQDLQDEAQRAQAVEAMRFAELRQAEADKIAWELSARPDLDGVPSAVQDFLFGTWALVLAHARLADKDRRIDPHGYLSVVTDLLWSVKREVTLRQPAQLFERVPRLVATLRAGLESIGREPEESEPFFQALMMLHHPVLKLRRAKSRRDARESGLAPLEAVDAPAPPAPDVAATERPAAGQPWMSPQELDAAGFEETLPTDMAGLAAEWADSGPAALEGHPGADEPPPAGPGAAEGPDTLGAAGGHGEFMLSRLREGDWVDLYSKRRWLRAQLIWASGNGALFMFVSRGGRPHSMTKRVCERLIRERYLRPVRMHGVVAHALGALVQEAEAA